MPTISRFEEIESWQLARELTNMVYGFTRREPFSRDFGLKDQICRASVSVMSNIAEGFESQTHAQFIRYLGIAKASVAEVRSQLYVALDQNYISKEEFQTAFDLSYKTLRKLVSFIAYLQANSYARRVSDGQVEYLIEH